VLGGGPIEVPEAVDLLESAGFVDVVREDVGVQVVPEPAAPPVRGASPDIMSVIGELPADEYPDIRVLQHMSGVATPDKRRKSLMSGYSSSRVSASC
jgi:hypothetical protein